jgi:hypothetical protein
MCVAFLPRRILGQVQAYSQLDLTKVTLKPAQLVISAELLTSQTIQITIKPMPSTNHPSLH